MTLNWPDDRDYHGWVERLADPLRARRAFHHLRLNEAALPAVRAGLGHPSGNVRMYCAQILDHLVDEESFPDLVEMLWDPDSRVRVAALHALACDRCKATGCRPTKADVLPRAIDLLRSDTDGLARAMAAEVVARWVHEDERALHALSQARDTDPHPAIRKKASWYAPGGAIYQKTKPRAVRA